MDVDCQYLAIASGVPTFPEMLHVGCPNVGDEEQLMARVRQTPRSALLHQ